MKIITIPNRILFQKTKPVTRVDKRILQLTDQMINTLLLQHNPEGVGLAAPQVGILLKIFVIRADKKMPARVFINPAYNKHGARSTKHEAKNPKKGGSQKLEGCLSIPHIWGRVDRPTGVTLQYQTIDGKKNIETFTGFEAVVVCHEMDHLEGILFTQNVLKQGHKLYREVDGQLERYEI